MPTNALPLKRMHHVELIVGNAKQAEYFYRVAMGFDRIAYAGPETGVRAAASYVMQQGDIRLVLTTPLSPDDARTAHLAKHGDAVWNLAFEVDDADAVLAKALSRGATAYGEAHTIEDATGRPRLAAIRTFGDTVHGFISKGECKGSFLPNFREDFRRANDVGLKRIDHCVGNVEDGKMNEWADFYTRVFGFKRFLSFDDKDISTEYSALRSVVMSSPSGHVKFPINEPAAGKGKSQIQEYVDFHHGAGVQHVALLTTDILATVADLKERGVEFLHVPDAYYDEVWKRVGSIAEPTDAVRRLGILVDRDDEGYLLQLFTKPVQDRPTLFFEIIQRAGSQSFGKGNFKALFESIEREQAARGNL